MPPSSGTNYCGCIINSSYSMWFYIQKHRNLNVLLILRTWHNGHEWFSPNSDDTEDNWICVYIRSPNILAYPGWESNSRLPCDRHHFNQLRQWKASSHWPGWTVFILRSEFNKQLPTYSRTHESPCHSVTHRKLILCIHTGSLFCVSIQIADFVYT